MDELIRSAGSFWRLMEQYWTGRLTTEQERLIEDNQPKATLASYKPVRSKSAWNSETRQWEIGA